MKMTWTPVEDGDGGDCASAECNGKATWYGEAGGTGSYYCDDCHDLIKAQSAMKDYERNGGVPLADLQIEKPN